MEATITFPRALKRVAVFILFLLAAIAFTWQHLPAQDIAASASAYCADDYCCSVELGADVPSLTREELSPAEDSLFWQDYTRGIGYLEAGESELAALTLNEALIYRPHYVKALVNLGRAYIEMRRYESAEDVVDEAIMLDSTYADAHSTRARAMNALGDSKAAVSEYEKSLSLNEVNPYALNNLAMIHLLGERYGDAAPLLEKAVAQKDTVAFFFNNLGMAYEGLGKLDQAMAAFQRALEITADYAKAGSNLVRVQTLLASRIELAGAGQTSSGEVTKDRRPAGEQLSAVVMSR